MDFSSAFNSMKTHILLKRVTDLNINTELVLWIRDFLSCRPQRVCVRGSMSDVLTLSIGFPQGCVLSPVLFSLFTNGFMINEEHFRLFKSTALRTSVQNYCFFLLLLFLFFWSVLTFHLHAWYSHLNCRSKNKLSRIVSMASKIVCKPQNPLTQLFTERARKKARSILADSSHPLFSQFEPLSSRWRYRTPLATKNIFKKSFIPGAIHILNSTK